MVSLSCIQIRLVIPSLTRKLREDTLVSIVMPLLFHISLYISKNYIVRCSYTARFSPDGK